MNIFQKIATFLVLVGISAGVAVAGKINPKAKAAFKKGIENYNSKNYSDALTLFNQAVELDKNYEDAYLFRAYTNEKLGNSFQAIEDYNSVTKINDKNKTAVLMRGHLHSKIGLDDDAIRDYARVIELDNRNYDAHYQRALIYNIQGLFLEALKDFEKCASIKPGAEIDYMTGTIESKMGNEEKAIHYFTNAMKYDKDNKNFYFHRADSKIKLGRYHEAMHDLKICHRLDSQDAYIYHRMGVVFHYTKEYENAIKHFDRAIDLNPVVTEFFVHRAKTLVVLTRYEKAIADFTMILDLDPQSMDPLISRAMAHTSLGQFDKADADYSKYIEMNPYNFYIYQKRADVRLQLKDMDGALSDLNALIELKPENANAYFNRAMLEVTMDKKEDACKDYKKSGELGNKESSDTLKKACGE